AVRDAAGAGDGPQRHAPAARHFRRAAASRGSDEEGGMRLRDKRERQALKFLTMRQCVSASDLARAATAGEGRVPHAEGLGALGMMLGNHFIRRGFARLDKFNRYEWVP